MQVVPVNNNGFKFCVLNAQSLNNKAACFTDFICENNLDLVALTETWFTDRESASKTQCTPPSYKFFDHPRFARRGGGTGLLFKDNMSVSKIAGGEQQSFEYSEWNVHSGSQRISLIIIYRPPYSEAHPVTTAMFHAEFAKYLESVVLSVDPLLIVGDFNIHVNCQDDIDTTKLLDLFESTGLEQHVQIPTHHSGHTLDLIVTRLTDRIVASPPPRAECLFSDHMPVFCQLQLKRAPLTKSKVSYRNVAAINMDALRKDLSNSSLCKNIESLDLNDLVACYNKTLESVLNHHAPLKTKIVTTRPVVPWFNEEVKSAKRQRRKAERRWRRTDSYSDLKAYKMQKNYTILVMNRTRKSFYTVFISDNSTDQRQLFKAAKILFTQRSDLTFPDYEDSNILANDIGEFFIQRLNVFVLSLSLLLQTQTI